MFFQFIYSIWLGAFGPNSWFSKLLIGPAVYGIYNVLDMLWMRFRYMRKAKKNYRENVGTEDGSDFAELIQEEMGAINKLTSPLMLVWAFVHTFLTVAVVAAISSWVASLFRH